MDQIRIILEKFKSDPTQEKRQFPPMSTDQRLLVHQEAERLGLWTQSVGSGEERHIIVHKTESEQNEDDDSEFLLEVCEAFGIPIARTDSMTWNHLLPILDDYFKISEKVKMAERVREVAKSKNMSFRQYKMHILDQMARYVRDNPAFQVAKDKASTYEKEERVRYQKKHEQDKKNDYNVPKFQMYNRTPLETFDDVPIEQVSGRWYISVDGITFQFSALRIFDPSLFDGTKSWKEFIQKFTDLEFFWEAKPLRQIFWGLLGFSNFFYQKVLFNNMYDAICTWNDEHPSDWIQIHGSLSTDELILGTTKESLQQDLNRVQNALTTLDLTEKDIWRIEGIHLIPIPLTKWHLRVNYHADSSKKGEEIRGVPKHLYVQVYKKVYGLAHHPYDLRTVLNGVYVTMDRPYFL